MEYLDARRKGAITFGANPEPSSSARILNFTNAFLAFLGPVLPDTIQTQRMVAIARKHVMIMSSVSSEFAVLKVNRKSPSIKAMALRDGQ